MGINRRSFISFLIHGGCAITALACRMVRVAHDLTFKRIRYAETGNQFPGRRKDLRHEDVDKPSHWLG